MRNGIKTKLTGICENCSSDFLYYRSRLKAGAVRFCSVKCCRDKFVGENNPNWKGGLKDCFCKLCGASFRLKKKDVLTTGNYCSTKCSHIGIGIEHSAEAKTKRIKKKCIVCNTEILIKPSHAIKNGMYCSGICQKKDYKIRFAGTLNPNYRNGESVCNDGGARRRKLMKTANSPRSRKISAN